MVKYIFVVIYLFIYLSTRPELQQQPKRSSNYCSNRKARLGQQQRLDLGIKKSHTQKVRA